MKFIFFEQYIHTSMLPFHILFTVLTAIGWTIHLLMTQPPAFLWPSTSITFLLSIIAWLLHLNLRRGMVMVIACLLMSGISAFTSWHANDTKDDPLKLMCHTNDPKIWPRAYIIAASASFFCASIVYLIIENLWNGF
jgi:hypothetical protein